MQLIELTIAGGIRLVILSHCTSRWPERPEAPVINIYHAVHSVETRKQDGGQQCAHLISV